MAAFLVALAETSSVTKACAYIDMSTPSAYALRAHPDAVEFRNAWDSALAARFEMLADLAFERVRNGVERNRWWQGQLVGVDHVFSDRLLIHLMNSCDPARERPAAVTPAVAGVGSASITAVGSASVTAVGSASVTAVGSASSGHRPVIALGDDFAIAAAVATGRLGWDPEDDEQPLPLDIAADVAAMQRAHIERVERDSNLRAKVDAMTKSFDPPPVHHHYPDGTIRPANGPSAEDLAMDAQFDDVLRALGSLTCSSSPPQAKKSRSAARVSSGASSGRK